MAPLVPDIIDSSFNYIIALLIGVAFGMVLEQAGFSSSRKLAGLFYGRDFTVLRVFFTAAITAMAGLVFFSYFGWIDLSLIYINPTFLLSAIVGGVIMGLGFIIGGFCPGTSVCAAAIGKIDAFAFLGGILLGIFIFGESYSVFKDLYTGNYLGTIMVYNSLGISKGMFVFLLITTAIIAFIATAFIQWRVTKSKPKTLKTQTQKYIIPVSLALILGVISMFIPTYEQQITKNISDNNFIQNYQAQTISADELAYRVIDKDENLQLIDVRTPDQFKAFAIPGAINIPLDSLKKRYWSAALKSPKKTRRIFIGANQRQSKQAVIIAERLGFSNNYALKGGMIHFKDLIFSPTAPTDSTNKQARYDFRFRSKASREIMQLIEDNKNRQQKPQIQKRKRVSGGCS